MRYRKRKQKKKLEHASPLILSSSFKIPLTILGSLYFRMNSRMCLSISGRKKRWDFDRDCIEPADQFGEYSRLNNIKSFNSWTQDTFPCI